MTDTLSKVLQPIETAHGLPNAHYISQETYNEERKALFFDQWSGLAVGSDVPNNGDAKPIDFAGIPLLLMRGSDGVVRVFQNTCRHRGMILVDEPRNIEGAIRCPYHSWCYSHKGKLVSTPHIGGPGQNIHAAIDKSEIGLIEVRSHVWFDIVWVNVSGNAAEFDVGMAKTKARLSEFDQPMYRGSGMELALNCNWKLGVENYCESYHLPWVHPGLNAYSKLEDHYNILEKGSFSGQGTVVYRQIKGDDGTIFPDFDQLSEMWNTSGEYLAIYPNILVGVQRDHIFTFVILPEGPEKCREEIHIYYSAPQVDAALNAKNTEQWRVVFKEDIFVVEGMQKGRHSPGFDGGKFSPVMDNATHCFHEWVAGQVVAARA